MCAKRRSKRFFFGKFGRFALLGGGLASAGADGREMVRGSVLEGGEGLVRLQALRNVLGALITNAIVAQTASES